MTTNRLLFRPFTLQDADALFKLDADPAVMRYLGNNPLTHIDQSHHYLEGILKQYEDYGIGRWAVIEQSSNEVIGWAGIKFIADEVNGHHNFYDLGYRLRPAFWGKGYATEATFAWIEYAKEKLPIRTLYASAHEENVASRNVLKKCGFIEQGTFLFPLNGAILPCFWYELTW